MQFIMLKAAEDPEANLYEVLNAMTQHQVFKNIDHLVKRLVKKGEFDEALRVVDHYLIGDYADQRRVVVRKYILFDIGKDRAMELAKVFGIPESEVEDYYTPVTGEDYDY